MSRRCLHQTARRYARGPRRPVTANTSNPPKLSEISLSPSMRRISIWIWVTSLSITTLAAVAITERYFPENVVDRKERLEGLTSFKTYNLAKVEPVSSTASIFHLQPERRTITAEVYKTIWKKGIWNVQFKQPQIQIVRAYTPLPPRLTDSSSGYLRFLIRHDPRGEFSSYLHRLPLGSNIELRGPYVEYELPRETTNVLFLAGGTGIAPALQIAHAMFNPEHTDDPAMAASKSKRSLHIMWANRDRTDCVGGQNETKVTVTPSTKTSWWSLWAAAPDKITEPQPETNQPTADDEKGLIVQELEMLKQRYPGRVVVDYFVDNEKTFIGPNEISKALSRPAKALDSATQSAGLAEHQEIIVSGPPGFITALAGAKQWWNGREEQGPVGGILALVLSQGSTRSVNVWKV